MLMSCGNAPRSKQFLKQLIKSGTETPVESVLGLSDEKLFIITGIMSYQQYVQSADLSMPPKACFIHVFLKPPPIKSIALLKSIVRNASGATMSHLFLPQLTQLSVKVGWGFFTDAARDFAGIKPTEKPLD